MLSLAEPSTPRRRWVCSTFPSSEHRAFGGHLMKGKAWMSNEIGMVRLEDVVSRRAFDPKKKVGVLHISELRTQGVRRPPHEGQGMDEQRDRHGPFGGCCLSPSLRPQEEGGCAPHFRAPNTGRSAATS